MSSLKDINGRRFGRLRVQGRAPSVTTPCGTVKARWVCLCDCGKYSVVKASNLTKGTTKSCGCLVPEVSRANRLSETRHGHTSKGRASATYSTWRAMMGRCLNQNHKDYPRYGKRGITIAEAWQSFEGFLASMGTRPTGTTLDRFPDKFGNYEDGNCRWASPTEQSRNLTTTKLSVLLAERIRLDSRTQLVIAAEYGVSRTTVSNIKRGKVWR